MNPNTAQHTPTFCLIDQNGRLGLITETRTHDGRPMYFARPVNVPYVVKDTDGRTCVAHAEIITVTAWYTQPDGSLHGLWWDSPPSGFVAAQIVTYWAFNSHVALVSCRNLLDCLTTSPRFQDMTVAQAVAELADNDCSVAAALSQSRE